MAVKYTGTGVFKYGLDVQGQFPLDSRIVVNYASDLDNYKTLFISGGVPVWYVGMVVFAEDTKKLYVLESEEAGFKPIGADASQLANLFTYKGNVSTYADLASKQTTAKVGDVYNVVAAFEIGLESFPAGTNVVWNGTSWDTLAGSVDLSNYATKKNVSDAVDPVSAVANAAKTSAEAANTALNSKVDKKDGFDLISDTDLAVISTNASAIQTLQQKLEGVDFASDAQRLQAVEALASSNQQGIAGHETRIGSLEGSVKTHGESISGLQSKSGQVDTNAANITNLQSDVNTLKTDVAGLKSKECSVKGVKSGEKLITLGTDGMLSTDVKLQYDSTNKKIELKNGEVVVADLDAKAFVKDGMISSVTYSDKTITITWNTESDKTPNTTTIALSDLVDIYTAGAGLSVTNNQFKIELSTDEKNILSMKDNKLYADLEWEMVE